MRGKIIRGEGGDFLDPTLLEVGRKGSVIPVEELLATDLAKEILEKAREEAAKIREKAELVLEEAIQEKEEERKRGYEEGHQQGLQELSEKIMAVDLEREKTLEAQEPEIVQMVLEIAGKVVARELKKKAIVDIVRRAISGAVGE